MTNEFTVVQKNIKPKLEQTFRWLKMGPGEDEHFYEKPKEDVWTHTLSCIKRAIRLINQYPELRRFINYKTLLQTILFHDAPEGYSKYGDVTQGDPDRERKKAENNEDSIFRETLIQELGLPEYLYSQYQHYNLKDTPEALIAKLIDEIDADKVWWEHLTFEFRVEHTKVKSRAIKLEEFFNFMQEKIVLIRANQIQFPDNLVIMLLKWLKDSQIDLIFRLPEEDRIREQRLIELKYNELLNSFAIIEN